MWTNFLPDGLSLKENLKRIPFIDIDIAPSPYSIIAEVGGMKLLKFEPYANTPCTNKNPTLIVPSMINRYYVLDLLPEKSFIEYLRKEGHCVYLIDWGIPKNEDNHLSFDDLITRRFDYFVDKCLENFGSFNDQVHLIGHCLGGTLAAIYAPLFQHKIKSTMLLTTPVDFDFGGKLGVWASQPMFNVQNLTKAYGHMPWWMMQSSFQMLKPMLWLNKLEKLAKEYKNTEFMRNFIALELWSQDNVSFPGKCFNTLINEFYRKNSLVKGELQVQDQRVNLKSLKSPVLNVAASDDHIVLFNSTMQPYHLNEDANFETFSVTGGHIGSLLGSKAQKNLWPKLSAWIKTQDLTTPSA